MSTRRVFCNRRQPCGYGEPALAAMRAVKCARDPHGIMNPGKIVMMERVDEGVGS